MYCSSASRTSAWSSSCAGEIVHAAVATPRLLPAVALQEVIHLVQVRLDDLDLGHLFGAQHLQQCVPGQDEVAGQAADAQFAQDGGRRWLQQHQFVGGPAQGDAHLVEQAPRLEAGDVAACAVGQAQCALVGVVEAVDDDRGHAPAP